MDFLSELQQKGYCIIENVLSEEEINTALQYFHEWLNSNEKMKIIHNKIDPHGIFKHHRAGHTKHAWYIRTRENVQNIFKKIWNTDELVVSYDGCCWLDKDIKKKDNIWTHTDQAPVKTGLRCYQGFVSFTDNITRTIVVYENSHELHEKYGKDRNITSAKDWLLIDHDYLKEIEHLKRVVPIKAGSLFIWDSRTFHQNQYGTNPEERIVQYVSYLPKSGRSEKMRQKRLKYFLEKRTTSHWAYPVKVNGLQCQTYGNNDLIIDYDSLIEQDISEFQEEIEKLI